MTSQGLSEQEEFIVIDRMESAQFSLFAFFRVRDA
jgi:hypothetical protein